MVRRYLSGFRKIATWGIEWHNILKQAIFNTSKIQSFQSNVFFADKRFMPWDFSETYLWWRTFLKSLMLSLSLLAVLSMKESSFLDALISTSSAMVSKLSRYDASKVLCCRKWSLSCLAASSLHSKIYLTYTMSPRTQGIPNTYTKSGRLSGKKEKHPLRHTHCEQRPMTVTSCQHDVAVSVQCCLDRTKLYLHC